MSEVSKPKVSVVIPIFNHEKFIKKALTSVFYQTYTNIDIIVIDDGSTDNSFEIAKTLLTQSPYPYRLIQQENSGAHSAINKGICISTGEYINILNSDDFFSLNRIKIMVDEVANKGHRFGFSSVEFVGRKNQIVSTHYRYAKQLKQKLEDIQKYPSVGFALLDSNITISTGNFFFEKALFKEVGEFCSFRYCHDWEYALRVLFHTEPVYVNKITYFYRLHPNNSFRSLADAATKECPVLMGNYLEAVSENIPLNTIAPSEANWPGFYKYFIQANRYQTMFGRKSWRQQ